MVVFLYLFFVTLKEKDPEFHHYLKKFHFQECASQIALIRRILKKKTALV